MDIKTKRALLKKEIALLLAEALNLQNICTHPNAIHTNRADTGNYSKADDIYWTSHMCPDCEKCWSTDQDWNR